MQDKTKREAVFVEDRKLVAHASENPSNASKVAANRMQAVYKSRQLEASLFGAQLREKTIPAESMHDARDQNQLADDFGFKTSTVQSALDRAASTVDDENASAFERSTATTLAKAASRFIKLTAEAAKSAAAAEMDVDDQCNQVGSASNEPTADIHSLGFGMRSTIQRRFISHASNVSFPCRKRTKSASSPPRHDRTLTRPCCWCLCRDFAAARSGSDTGSLSCVIGLCKKQTEDEEEGVSNVWAAERGESMLKCEDQRCPTYSIYSAYAVCIKCGTNSKRKGGPAVNDSGRPKRSRQQ